MTDIRATLDALPAIFFEQGEQAFDLLCEPVIPGGIQLLLSMAQVRRAAQTSRALILDEEAARIAFGLQIDLGPHVILVGDLDSETLWATAADVRPVAVLTYDDEPDTAVLAGRIQALIG